MLGPDALLNIGIGIAYSTNKILYETKYKYENPGKRRIYFPTRFIVPWSDPERYSATFQGWFYLTVKYYSCTAYWQINTDFLPLLFLSPCWQVTVFHPILCPHIIIAVYLLCWLPDWVPPGASSSHILNFTVIFWILQNNVSPSPYQALTLIKAHVKWFMAKLNLQVRNLCITPEHLLLGGHLEHLYI